MFWVWQHPRFFGAGKVICEKWIQGTNKQAYILLDILKSRDLVMTGTRNTQVHQTVFNIKPTSRDTSKWVSKQIIFADSGLSLLSTQQQLM
jgi:hypothetical protein